MAHQLTWKGKRVMEIKEIEQVKEIPYGMSLEDWFEKEGTKIIKYLQNDNTNYQLINLKKPFDYFNKNIFILDCKNKKFENDKIICSDDEIRIYNYNYYYYKIITKMFYKLKGWELPKKRNFKKITDLQYGEYFKFKEVRCHCKFICIDENEILYRELFNDKREPKAIYLKEDEIVEIIDEKDLKMITFNDIEE